MTLPARRPVVVAVPVPHRAPERRAGRHLRVVEEVPAARHLPPRVLATLVVTVLFVAMFGLAVFHTVLVQGQQRLDALDERVDVAQATFEGNRLEAARLESPGRIVEAAVQAGMVPAPEVIYLVPERAIDPGEPLARPPVGSGESVPDAAEQAAEASATWAGVKPFLDGGA